MRASDGLIVGVHTNGGCTNPASAGHNHGVRITSILAQSSTLQTLTTPTLKFFDDCGTLKFVDDGGTLKFCDDSGTLKFIDDKGVDTQKFTDDGGTLKFIDDKGADTQKFTDDGGTLKFIDDKGADTQKFTDDGGTLKFIDDVKQPGLDKQFGDQKVPGTDVRPPIQPGVPGTQPQTGIPSGVRPFVLATPHHSMAWARGRETPQAGGRELQEQYEATITQLAQMLQQGSEELERLNEQYQRMVAEYQALVSGQQY